MSMTARTCSWCHRLNPVEVQTCPGCGHDAQVSRMECGCPRCRRPAARPQDDPLRLASLDSRAATLGQRPANARLIAAAPDLLAACRAVLALFPRPGPTALAETMLRQVRAAVARATE